MKKKYIVLILGVIIVVSLCIIGYLVDRNNEKKVLTYIENIGETVYGPTRTENVQGLIQAVISKNTIGKKIKIIYEGQEYLSKNDLNSLISNIDIKDCYCILTEWDSHLESITLLTNVEYATLPYIGTQTGIKIKELIEIIKNLKDRYKEFQFKEKNIDVTLILNDNNSSTVNSKDSENLEKMKSNIKNGRQYLIELKKETEKYNLIIKEN